MSFLAKMDYFDEKSCVTSQIFAAAVIPSKILIFLEKMFFWQIFVAVSQENTCFWELSITIYAAVRLIQIFFF